MRYALDSGLKQVAREMGPRWDEATAKRVCREGPFLVLERYRLLRDYWLKLQRSRMAVGASGGNTS